MKAKCFTILTKNLLHLTAHLLLRKALKDLDEKTYYQNLQIQEFPNFILLQPTLKFTILNKNLLHLTAHLSDHKESIYKILLIKLTTKI